MKNKGQRYIFLVNLILKHGMLQFISQHLISRSVLCEENINDSPILPEGLS